MHGLAYSTFPQMSAVVTGCQGKEHGRNKLQKYLKTIVLLKWAQGVLKETMV